MSTLEVTQQVAAEQRLSAALGQFAGQWVAVRNHEVVANASTLRELLDEIGDTNSVDGFFQVAEEGTVAYY